MIEVFVSGRRGCVACISIDDTNDRLLVTAESDKLTCNQLHKWVTKQYPGLVVKEFKAGTGYIGLVVFKQGWRCFITYGIGEVYDVFTFCVDSVNEATAEYHARQIARTVGYIPGYVLEVLKA